MRAVVLLLLGLAVSGCQLLTNFVRPLVDDPDAGDASIEDASIPPPDDASTSDAGT